MKRVIYTMLMMIAVLAGIAGVSVVAFAIMDNRPVYSDASCDVALGDNNAFYRELDVRQ